MKRIPAYDPEPAKRQKPDPSQEADIFYIAEAMLAQIRGKIRYAKTITEDDIDKLTDPKRLPHNAMMVPVDMNAIDEPFEGIDDMVAKLGTKATGEAFIKARNLFKANYDESETAPPMTAKEWAKILFDEGDDEEEEHVKAEEVVEEEHREEHQEEKEEENEEENEEEEFKREEELMQEEELKHEEQEEDDTHGEDNGQIEEQNLDDGVDIFYVAQPKLKKIEVKISEGKEITADDIYEMTFPAHLPGKTKMVPVDMSGCEESFEDTEDMITRLGSQGAAEAFIKARVRFEMSCNKRSAQPITASEWLALLEDD